MRFMMLMIPKGYEKAKPGAMPDPKAIEAMMKYNDSLQKAGVLLSLDGLHPPSMGARISFSGGKPVVEQGPFRGVREVLGGYWMIDVKSKEEAIEWASRCPASDNEIIEIRQVQEFEDFPEEVQKAAAGFKEIKVRPAHRSVQKITPFLWFDHQAEEAVHFYTSIFSDSRIVGLTRYGEQGAAASGQPKGSVMTVAFQLAGQDFVAINGGPIFKFTEALSLVVNCDSQEEVDHYWGNLSTGGDEKAQQCGWLKDKYGLSWQIVPTALGELLRGPDPHKSERVMQALLGMKKIDIAKLRQAYEQG